MWPGAFSTSAHRNTHSISADGTVGREAFVVEERSSHWSLFPSTEHSVFVWSRDMMLCLDVQSSNSETHSYKHLITLDRISLLTS